MRLLGLAPKRGQLPVALPKLDIVSFDKSYGALFGVVLTDADESWRSTTRPSSPMAQAP